MKISLVVLLCVITTKLSAQHSSIFPQPNTIEYNSESFVFNGQLVLSNIEYSRDLYPYLKQLFKNDHGIDLTLSGNSVEANVRLQRINTLVYTEGYQLTVSGKGVEILFSNYQSLCNAMQSLNQLIQNSNTISGVTISDDPAFGYRGVHLDCSRHFFTIAEIKGFIDHIARLKFNKFHWHLTDDQGWRLEIKRYPKLTEIGAWRDSTIIGHYSRSPREYEKQHYGGFYTQEEAREIVRYAAERGITVVPEIELPGHARAALAAYPELGCTGEQLPIPGLWGVFDDVFCSQPETMEFLKNVLEEVVAVFPSETIHIGGDECPKVRWDACAKCRRTMEENGLHDSHELQSYMIREMEGFLRARGRKLIGWDEILEGGLAENAQVMSWRGTEGGLAAAKQHHPVVMTPTAFCYLDYYQSGHPDEPLAIGGYLPLEKVYSFQPVPEGLTEEEKHFILGGQANLWTEYLPTMDAVEYSAYPRLIAMSQLLWTKDRIPYENFVRFLVEQYIPRLKAQGINYSLSFLDPVLTVQSGDGGIVYLFETPFKSVKSDPEKIVLKETNSVSFIEQRVTSVYEGQDLRATNYVFVDHSTAGIPVHFSTPPDPKFNTRGELGLTDGIKGKRPWKGDQWLGFSNDTVSFSIDLGKKRAFRYIEIGTLNDPGSWIYHPKQIVVEASTDGKKFSKWKPVAITGETIRIDKKSKARYLRITIVNDAQIPDGLPGAGTVPWTFLDELIIQ